MREVHVVGIAASGGGGAALDGPLKVKQKYKGPNSEKLCPFDPRVECSTDAKQRMLGSALWVRFLGRGQ